MNSKFYFTEAEIIDILKLYIVTQFSLGERLTITSAGIEDKAATVNVKFEDAGERFQKRVFLTP